MTDTVAARAASQAWRAHGRSLFRPSTLLLVAAVALLFARAVALDSSTFWLVLTGAGPAVFLVATLLWAIGLLLAPHLSRRRLARLPHRDVAIEFARDGVRFRTATELLEVAWSEIRRMKPLASFWLVCLRNGAEIPIPHEVLPDETLAGIRALAPAAVFDAPDG